MSTDSTVVDFANEVQNQSKGDSMYTLVYNEVTGQFERVLTSSVNESTRTPVNIPGMIWA